jgi:hypothetical protein
MKILGAIVVLTVELAGVLASLNPYSNANTIRIGKDRYLCARDGTIFATKLKWKASRFVWNITGDRLYVKLPDGSKAELRVSNAGSGALTYRAKYAAYEYNDVSWSADAHNSIYPVGDDHDNLGVFVCNDKIVKVWSTVTALNGCENVVLKQIVPTPV